MKESTKVGWFHFAIVAVPLIGVAFLDTKVDGIGGYMLGVWWTFLAMCLHLEYRKSERGRWKKDR